MLLLLHTGLKFLIALAGLAVIGYALFGVVKKRPHDATMKHLAITFRSLLDVNFFLGLVVVMTGFGFASHLGVHVILMLLATVVAHVVPAVMRRRPQEERSLLPYAVATAVSLVLVVLGGLSVRS